MTQDISPELFLDRLLGFQETAALKAAVRLGLFDALDQGPATAATVAASIGAAERGVRVLSDFLTLKGFLTKQAGAYALTPSTQVFLTRASPDCIADVVEFLAGEHQFQAYIWNPEKMVLNGGAVDQPALEPSHPMWVNYAKAMGPFMAPVAAAVAAEVAAWPKAPSRVLDIAASHGLFGIEVGKLSGATHVTAIDWAPVLEVATANAVAAGLSDRFEAIPGDALAIEWGADYDVILLPNFLHHFSPDVCAEVLAKARASLAPGGKALVVEFVPNEDRITPPFPARFAYVLLGSTLEGDAYTAIEYEAMRLAAGFGSLDVRLLPPSPQSLLIFAD